MDPKARRFLWNCIIDIVKDGRSVVLTSHRFALSGLHQPLVNWVLILNTFSANVSNIFIR